MFLILLAMRPAAAVHRWCQRWLPSNVLVRRVRTRAGLCWGIPLALVGVAYFGAGVVCVGMVHAGEPGWWYLGALACWWSALKLVGHGLFATVKLPIVRAQENLAVSRAIREAGEQSGDQSQPRQVWTRKRRRQLTREVRDTLRADREVLV
ncbi:hypothetical protein BSP109_02849 [Brevibacterium sp. Mu109]|uniref:hypothetical protein n=1 Tax=Brevibacterium sp. Mu109 TaxID=1255669 RepID=UPI000C54783F|nr:hypothetical protein [Brevibacterium sp. Mu109]SMX95193.1 hypothetical protein BSP109_02849 [Brevibacterium sp. Mu109]